MEISRIASQFGIQVSNVRRVSDAMLSEVFIVNDAYVLRSRGVAEGIVERFENECTLVEHVRSRINIAFPQLMRVLNMEQKYLLTDGLFWTAYPLIPGNILCNWWELDKLSAEETRAVFSALRDLHDRTTGTLANFEAANQYHFLDGVQQLFKKSRNDLNPDERERIERSIAFVEATQQDQSEVDACFVHGDYHPGNIIFRDNRIVGLLDTDWSRKGFSLEDLAYTTMMFLRDYRADAFIFDTKKFEECLRYYRLEDARKQALIEYLILYTFYELSILKSIKTLRYPEKMPSFQRAFLGELCTRF